MKSPTLLLLALFFAIGLSAQGTIKGIVLDQQSELPIIGAAVTLVTDDPNASLQGTVTDIDGYFTLENVPLGRQSLQVTYLGYSPLTIPNILVTKGKDAQVTLSIAESITALETVVVTADTEKDVPQNEMSTISARQFSVEEVNRYSGGRSDVARLAASFAGVSAPDDSRNDIVVRGNSPTGVLWRIEGIPVPSPNHFGTLGTTGGPVSALNPNIMRNSDFLTSAFSAEYGNATAGVFDIGFRNGNKDRSEYTFQVGAFSGIEGMAEGPVGQQGGSYVVAGRYSLVGIIGGLGVTAATPNYADLSFKVDLGNSKLGRFSVFGVGGNSYIDFLAEEVGEDDFFSAQDEDSFPTSNFGVLGVRHNLIVGKNAYVRTVIGGSVRNNDFTQDRYYSLGNADEYKLRVTNIDNAENRLTFSSYYNSKINARQTFRAGVTYERWNSNSFFEDRNDTPDLDGDGEPDWFTVYNFDGDFGLVQPFAETKYRLTERLTARAGVHAQYADINEQFVLEPRASLSYQFTNGQRLTAAYGLHNQLAPLPIMLLNEEVDGQLVRTNENLDFIRSQHYVLGYDAKLGTDWRIKSEVYYQALDQVPIDPFSSTYSTLVEGADFAFSDDKTSLVNEGTGFNRGVEITVEKFYSKNYYALVTGSLFESKYTASDGIERSTPFDNGYVLNVLLGREFPFGKDKSNSFTLDTKFTTAGGRWYTPVDLAASEAADREIRQEANAFSEQYDDYLRWDLKIGVKLNSKQKRLSQQFFLDFQNVTNRVNIFDLRYNRVTNELNQVNQIGFFPDVLYRVQF
ncbi:MAG: TonB-dependent receptor [Bacteroidota bacterium]